MRISNDYYLIVDLEATCSNVGAVPRHEMEIIEIGAVMAPWEEQRLKSMTAFLDTMRANCKAIRNSGAGGESENLSGHDAGYRWLADGWTVGPKDWGSHARLCAA